MEKERFATGSKVKVGHLIKGQEHLQDLRAAKGVEPEHIKARQEGALGTVGERIAGVRGGAFFVCYEDDEGLNPEVISAVAAHFSCEFVRPH